jgi:type II secretory pathway pseudopilin PulG
MTAMAILLVVMAAVFTQITKAQTRFSAENAKLDMTQDAREFLDQMARDIRASGFPKSVMFASPPALNATTVAAGVVKISPTTLWLEGDVSGDGNVYTVQYTYVASDANDATCPCIRRTQALKVSGGLSAQTGGTAYTEVQYVLDPTTAGQNLFTYYTYDSNNNESQLTFTSTKTSYDIENDLATMKLLKLVKINVTLRNTTVTVGQGTSTLNPQVSMTASARVNNQPL